MLLGEAREKLRCVALHFVSSRFGACDTVCVRYLVGRNINGTRDSIENVANINMVSESFLIQCLKRERRYRNMPYPLLLRTLESTADA